MKLFNVEIRLRTTSKAETADAAEEVVRIVTALKNEDEENDIFLVVWEHHGTEIKISGRSSMTAAKLVEEYYKSMLAIPGRKKT